MYKAIVIKKIVGDNGVEFFEGDRVRVLMKPSDPNRPLLANEYIGIINEIAKYNIILMEEGYGDFRLIQLDKIDRMRLAMDGENFYNTENFDD